MLNSDEDSDNQDVDILFENPKEAPSHDPWNPIATILSTIQVTVALIVVKD